MTCTRHYVVQFSDTHGNLSSFSDEVGSVATDARVASRMWTGITQVCPNPLNPTGRSGRFCRTADEHSRGQHQAAGSQRHMPRRNRILRDRK